MNTCEIIFKKRNKEKLTQQEIEFMVTGFVNGKIPDYQMSSFLMAVCLQGMDTEETTALTKSMLYSGEVYNLNSISGPKIDKHSTGGVGDGTSLCLAPLVAAAGVTVPMISGRALGHTGGTLDKLESIPGFKVDLTKKQFVRQLEKVGCAIISQTDSLVPADKKIYALRDVTATVESIPLITASIMSKKLAEGCTGLVLDIKTGNGAFMQDKSKAKELAESMISIGKKFNRKMVALVTDMNQPLGSAVGNALEIKQTIDVLSGKGPKDFTELVLELGSQMLLLSGKISKINDGQKLLKKIIDDGNGLEKFQELVIAQGGPGKIVEFPDKFLPSAKYKREIKSQRTGYINKIDTRLVGISSICLGAGRKTKDSVIDPASGMIIFKKLGDYVHKNDVLATLYANKISMIEEAEQMFLPAYKILAERVKIPVLLQAVVD